MSSSARKRKQLVSVVYAILTIVLLLVVMQLWLLTATMNAFLGGNHSVVWPAACASLVCLGLNFGLLRYLLRLDQSGR